MDGETAIRELVADAAEVQPPDPRSEPSEHERRVQHEYDALRARREAQRRLRADQRSVDGPAEALTLAERLAHPLPPLQQRIDGWQPLGSRVILAGPRKAGKSHASGNLIRCLADGERWLGVAPVTPVTGTVALIDTEMSDRQLVSWLADQRIEHPERVVVISLRGRVAQLDLLDDDVRAEWAALLLAFEVDYLILDCLRPVLDALSLDEHHDAGRFLVAFDELLAEASISDALLVHHMGHTGERSRGDSRLRDWPDVEWKLVRASDDDDASPRFISAYGRDVDVPETELHYAADTRHLTVVAGTGGRKAKAIETALADILAALDEATEPLSGRRIEQLVTAHPRATVRKATQLGVDRGEIDRTAGARGSQLHQRASAPERAASAPEQSSECASAPIGGALAHSPDDQLVRHSVELGSSVDQRRPLPAQNNDHDTSGHLVAEAIELGGRVLPTGTGTTQDLSNERSEEHRDQGPKMV